MISKTYPCPRCGVNEIVRPCYVGFGCKSAGPDDYCCLDAGLTPDGGSLGVGVCNECEVRAFAASRGVEQ